MNHSYWLIVIFVATLVCNTSSRPQDIDVKNVYPVYRPSKELDLKDSDSSPAPPVAEVSSPANATKPAPVKNEKEEEEKVTEKLRQNIEAIATVARASNGGPSLSPSVAMVADQLIDTVGQMVDTDMRTPPKRKETTKEKANENKKQEEKKEAHMEEKPHTVGEKRTEVIVDKIEANGKFELPDANERPASLSADSSEGKASHTKKKEEEGTKGVAVPVIMDDLDIEPVSPPKKLQKIPEVPKPAKDDKKKTGGKPNKENPTTTPSSGLSTWILLSDNREATTPSTKKNNKKESTDKANDDKKRVTTTKKPSKTQTTTTTTTTTAKPAKDDKVKVNVDPKQSSKKGGNSKPASAGLNEGGSLSALEAMVKNQKKSTTTVKPKTTEEKNNKKPGVDSKKKPDKISERIDAAETKDKVEIDLTDNKKVVTIPPVLLVTTDNPTTLAATDSGNADITTETSQETTTKKKSQGKKKKKNKNRKRKPSNKNDTQVDLKNANKSPKQPVGAQLYNFLSREIMPTVGLGLVGVLVTAGLAGLLGYNPFVAGNLPIRRTYESQHGYSPNNYYSYNSEYGDGGQSEEVLFREVLSGMPDESRYGITNPENSYPESQLYNSQEQAYDAMKSPVDAAYPISSEGAYSTSYSDKQETSYDKDKTTYDSTYGQDYSNAYGSTYGSQESKYAIDSQTKKNSEKHPVYNSKTGTSYVYPESDGTSSLEKTSRLNDEYGVDGAEGQQYSRFEVTGAEALTADAANKYGSDKISSKYSKTKTETIERQPEALYRVAGEAEMPYTSSDSTVQGASGQNSWHRIGSPMVMRHTPHLEPGPRSLDLTKESKIEPSENKDAKKRSKRSVVQRIGRKRNEKSEADIENEIDFDDSMNIDDLIKKHQSEISTEESTTGTTTTMASFTTTTSTSTTDESSTAYEETTQRADASTTEVPYNVKDSSTEQSSTTTLEDSETSHIEEPDNPVENGYNEEESNETSDHDANPNPETASTSLTFMDILKRLAQFKLKIGLNFLRSTTDAFSKYLDDMQKKVEESISNNTKVYSLRNSWARNLFRRRAKNSEDMPKERSRRSVMEDNEFLGVKRRFGDKSHKRYLRNSKKDPQMSKALLSKKKITKKYHPKRRD